LLANQSSSQIPDLGRKSAAWSKPRARYLTNRSFPTPPAEPYASKHILTFVTTSSKDCRSVETGSCWLSSPSRMISNAQLQSGALSCQDLLFSELRRRLSTASWARCSFRSAVQPLLSSRFDPIRLAPKLSMSLLLEEASFPLQLIGESPAPASFAPDYSS
jgi:hypothetical protein